MGAKRLSSIINGIGQCNILADVGCDHGYIGYGALANNQAKKVIFTDISSVSLAKAQKLCAINNQRNVEFVCTNGLCGITADCAVIAGMGGKEIMNIIKACDVIPDRLVLQPMKNELELRKFLCGNFKLTLDTVVYDVKFYPLIVAVKGQDEYTEMELQFGRTNLTTMHSDFIVQLRKLEEMYLKIYIKTLDVGVKSKLAQVQMLLNRSE